MTESTDIQQNNEQLLNDIQSLQKMEQQLFDSLDTNPNLTTSQQQQIVDKMNQISNMRVSLYKTLGSVNNYFQNALTSSQGTLTGQIAAISIVEEELNNSKNRLASLEQEKNNKIRLVQINDYYGDRYLEHSKLMKVVIFTLVPVIILAVLNNKGILPGKLYYGLIIVISIIGGVFFWKTFMSIITRDTMNYQAYDWYFDPNAAPTILSTSQGDEGDEDEEEVDEDEEEEDDPWVSEDKNAGTCVGEACCSEGQTYDESLDQCVGESTVENFMIPKLW
jgi:hypothetical protein